MSDYRGQNMSFMAEAHRKAHAADTQRDIAPQCSACGMKPEDQLHRNIPISKLQLCGRCQSVQYCSKQCQVDHWKVHKKDCKAMAKERKELEEATRAMNESETQKRIYALADDYPDDLPGQVKAFIQILANTKDDNMTALACANRLAEDLELLTECHNQGDAFYPVLCSLLEQDLAEIQGPISGKALALPSWNMATSILRCFPGETGYVMSRTACGITSYSEERCAAYFAVCWKAHLDFSVGLWKASRQGSPDLYRVCKDFWRQLPVCLIHQSVARAVFQSNTDEKDSASFSDPQSPRLKPLIGMLNLHDMADDLEGLTNQVAALLVVHARNMRDNDTISSAELERSITRRMDRYEKTQWRELSLVVAKAMVEKKRQLTNEEFRRIIHKIQQRG